MSCWLIDAWDAGFPKDDSDCRCPLSVCVPEKNWHKASQSKLLNQLQLLATLCVPDKAFEAKSPQSLEDTANPIENIKK